MKQNWSKQADELLAKMTLEEKAAQMKYEAPQIERLGIKSYNWWNEALHGVARAGTATMFPQSIGLAATFDENLVYEVADCISTEGRAKYNAFQEEGDHTIYKGLTFWSPNINIFRDPRWGRGHETYGEDPYLTGRLGVSFIKGMQGNDPDFMKTAACAKHYAVHSGPESVRHEFDAVISEKDLYETYLPAFEECVKEGQVEAVMGAYNAFNGIPCCGSKRLLEDILRGDWGFEGHVVSDCGAIFDFHSHHRVTKTVQESAAMAVKAGCDLNCGIVYAHIMAAIHEGLLSEDDIDKCVKRLLITRLKLGTIGNQKTPWDGLSILDNDTKEHHALSLKAAKESLVLLKNNGILPLDKNKISTVAVIGPNADSLKVLQGNYCGTASEAITVLCGIRACIGEKAKVLFAEGSHLYKADAGGCIGSDDSMSEAIITAKAADAVVLCVGLDSSLEGEEGDGYNSDNSGDKAGLSLPSCQQRLMEAVAKLNKPTILVNMSGSAVDISFADERFSAIIQAWYPGQMGGQAVAELIFGAFSPSGKLPITFYKTTDELPPFEDYAMKGRTYRYMENEALYPFGFGLSYTRFEYENLKINQSEITSKNDLTVTVDIRNAGDCDGAETVQAYLTLPGEGQAKWSLCGVQKLSIPAGKTKIVTMTVPSERMRTVDENGKRFVIPGIYKLYIGGSQPDSRSCALFGSKPETIEFIVKT